ncbi:TPA: hypothetical protein ACFOT0_001248 [Neisseria meningitidis]
MPYDLYCLRLRRLVLIFVNPLYFHTRERLGALGGIVQHHTALYRSVAVYEPAVLIVGAEVRSCGG